MRLNPYLIIGAFILLFGGAKVYTQTRGLRNNNPTNIRKSGDQWQGLADNQTDSAFFIFSDPLYGIRAAAKILQNYNIKYGIQTVSGIINRWAPSTENDTISYINHVAKELKVNKDQVLNLQDNFTLAQLISVIIKHENGFNPYSIGYITQGVKMA